MFIYLCLHFFTNDVILVQEVSSGVSSFRALIPLHRKLLVYFFVLGRGMLGLDIFPSVVIMIFLQGFIILVTVYDFFYFPWQRAFGYFICEFIVF